MNDAETALDVGSASQHPHSDLAVHGLEEKAALLLKNNIIQINIVALFVGSSCISERSVVATAKKRARICDHCVPKKTRSHVRALCGKKTRSHLRALCGCHSDGTSSHVILSSWAMGSHPGMTWPIGYNCRTYEEVHRGCQSIYVLSILCDGMKPNNSG